MKRQEFITVLEGWYRDLLLGLRALRRSPVFCLASMMQDSEGLCECMMPAW